jgi:hypothetical protein
MVSISSGNSQSTPVRVGRQFCEQRDEPFGKSFGRLFGKQVMVVSSGAAMILRAPCSRGALPDCL